MSNRLRPWRMLPFPHPKDFDPSETEPDYFYKNFIKPSIPDIIKLMNAGLHIDQQAVEALRKTVDEVLVSVSKRLKENTLIQEFQKEQLPKAQKEHEEKCTQSLREKEYYLSTYNSKNIIHRTWVVNCYLKHLGLPEYVKDKWAIKDLKDFNLLKRDDFIADIIGKRNLVENDFVISSMDSFAEYKLSLWNTPRYEKAKEPVTLEPFNPGSNKQVKEFFQFMKVAPLAFSKTTGEASWGRDQIEELQKMESDKDLLKVLQVMVDYSYGSIIKTTFLKAFDAYTIDGVLHGTVKLFGAKSYRPTSKKPNLLNMPSTGSDYAEPLKRCFIASKGRVIYTADEAALEDRVIANLSNDVNKLAIFTEGLDGHSVAATYYFRERVTAIIGEFTDFKEASKKLKTLVDDKNKIAKVIRQDGKPVSFGLSYGAYPPKVAQSIKCALEEAERIFNVYHHELFPGITKYREEYVLPTCLKQGYLHLGLGCRIYSDDPRGDIRTLANATVQFWSILTLIALNEFNYRVAQEGLTNNLDVISTIYDSIYVDVDKDPEIIQWVNNNLIECLTVQYLEDEKVHNEAEGEIGLNFADLHKVSNNASVGEIKTILEEL